MAVQAPARLEARHINPWAVFAVAALAQVMVILDASIVNVALPSIQRGLHFSQADLQWVINIYVLMFGGFLLLGGRAGDLFGRRRMLMIGLFLFSAASLAGGLAHSAAWLVAARAAQGLGGAILSPVALAIVSSTFEEGAARNRAVGIFGSLAGIGGAIGVLLGGVLTQYLGWQWVLFVNVPIGAAAIIGATQLIPNDRLPEMRAGFDLPGAFLVTAGLVSLVYGVVKAPSAGWGSATALGFLAAAVVLIAAFIVRELRTADPLVRLDIFKKRNVTVADIAGGLSAAGMFSMFFFLSLYMQIVLRYDALQTGIRYLPLALSIMVSAALTSQLVTRFGYKYIMALGLAVAAGGLYWLTRIHVHGSFEGDVLFPMLLLAFGLGMTFVPLQIASVSGVPPDDIGLASGLVNAFLQVGGAIGLAVLSTISTTEFNGVVRTIHSPLAYPTALVDGFQHAFAAGSILMLAGAAVVLLLLPQGGAGAAQAVVDESEEMEPVTVA
ncbi:MAG TPA: MFS transporter [Chloroflexota bacterium]|nr:MFS transporter [Chloroflexota bacterium]